MAHNSETRRRLRTAYVSGLSLEEAATQAKVALSTATRWRSQAKDQGDDWERHRAASLVSGSGKNDLVQDILRQFLIAHQTAMTDLAKAEIPPDERVKLLAQLSDAFNKTMSSLAKTSPMIDRMGIASRTLEIFSGLTKQRFPQHSAAILEIMDTVGPELERLMNHGEND
ncbi:MAG: DUF1804 family protein [Magnetococcales bacterium]|nr:DUF1804 family protein [Magnetococcales bacterium]